MVARGKAEKGLWEGQVHTAVFKTDNWKRPTVEHGELCSMLCARLDGGHLGENEYTQMQG